MTRTVHTVTLRRVRPGYYRTPCGRFEIVRVEYDRDMGYGATGWYWYDNDNPGCEDHYATKREAVSALRLSITTQGQSA